MGERLVRVERFEELTPGLRVVVKQCRRCTGTHAVIISTLYSGYGIEPDDSVMFGTGWIALPAPRCCQREAWVINPAVVAAGLVFRFASDVDNDAALAAEANPYLSREAIGTGGRDEVRVAVRKEKAR